VQNIVFCPLFAWWWGWQEQCGMCVSQDRHCSHTHPNNLIKVFQSFPWPQVYKFKHLGMEIVSTNICERMGRSQELSEFQRGIMIGCPLCIKSSHEISSLLNILQSTVSGIITKWKRMEIIATQPQSGR